MAAGDLAAYEARMRKLIDAGRGAGRDYNTLAWTALFRRDVGEQEIAWARRAVELSGRAPFALHTLASVYANAGQVGEAVGALRESIHRDGRFEPRPEDEYVLGKIAEQCGMRDAAIRYYARVGTLEAPPRDPLSTQVLARRRLIELGAMRKIMKPE